MKKGKKIGNILAVWLLGTMVLGSFASIFVAFLANTWTVRRNSTELLEQNVREVTENLDYLLDYLRRQGRESTEEAMEEIALLALNRHIGQNGYLLIHDREGTIVASPDVAHNGDRIQDAGIDPAEEGAGAYVLGDRKVYGVRSYTMVGSTDDEEFRVIGVYPWEEAVRPRRTAVMDQFWMQIALFVLLFMVQYALVKRYILRHLEEVNDSLRKIASGDLEERVRAGGSVEFEDLSDKINGMVTELKGLLDREKERNDQDMENARLIQASVLPQAPPAGGPVDIYASMAPAKEVGGDFYDFYPLPNGKIAFLIADVSGKGIPAAMFMMRAKPMIKGYVELGCSPGEALCRVNDLLCEGNDACMFVTCWLGILDLSTGRLTYANAGHNAPLWKHGSGDYAYLEMESGFVMAAMEGMDFPEGTLELSLGDQLYLYTDGVTEADNVRKKLFGEERLEKVLNRRPYDTASETCLAVKQDLDAFVGRADQADDITMLCISWKKEVDRY